MGCVPSTPVVYVDGGGGGDGKAVCQQQKRNNACRTGTSAKSGFTYRKNTCALEYWEPLRLLGEGSISSIHLVQRRLERIDVPYKERADIMRVADVTSRNKTDNIDESELFALKSIMKDHVRNDRHLEEMRSEIYTMSRLCHDNIVNVVEAFERKRHIYLIMACCRGGDLCERQPTEAEAAVIIRKVLQAVAYMHQHNVVHRDLKLENIMFDKDPSDPTAEIKVIDFGLATKFLSNDYKQMTARVGTLYSMSPQVLQGEYDFKCDMWSIGVVCYMLLSGGLNPFWGPPREMSWEKRKKIMVDRIMRCEYMKMKGPTWDKISPEAKTFVGSLLQINPKRRPTAAAALQSPWIVKYQDYQPNGMPVQAKQYTKKIELKRDVKVLLARDLPEDDIVRLKDALQQQDPRKEDRVSIAHFRNSLLQSPQLKKDKVESLFDGRDLDMNENIDYMGMLNDALERKMRKQEDFIVNIFSHCGADACCKIPKEKLLNMLAESSEAADDSLVFALKTIIDEIDGDGGENGDFEDDGISCQTIVKRMKQHEMERINDISSCRGGQVLFADEGEDDDEDSQDLVDENNAVIPGGRSRDPNAAKPLWEYDDVSKSIRKFGGESSRNVAVAEGVVDEVEVDITDAPATTQTSSCCKLPADATAETVPCCSPGAS